MERPEDYKGDKLDRHFKDAFEDKHMPPAADAWEGVFWRSAFAEKGKTPPASVWQNIQTTLHPTVPFYRRTWFKYSAAAVLALLSSLPFLMNERSTEKSLQVESMDSAFDAAVQVLPETLAPPSEDYSPKVPNQSAFNSSSDSGQELGLGIKKTALPDLFSNHEGSASSKALQDAIDPTFESHDATFFSIAPRNLVVLSGEYASILAPRIISRSEAFSAIEEETTNQPPVFQELNELNLLLQDKITEIPGLSSAYKGLYTRMFFNSGIFNPNFSLTESDILNIYAIARNGNNAQSIAVQPQLGERHVAERSFAINLGLGYRFNSNFSLETGAIYGLHSTLSKSNVIASPMHFSWEKPVTVAMTQEERLRPQMQYEVTSAYEVRNTFEAIGIPLLAVLDIPMNKFELQVKGGLQANVLLSNRIADTKNLLIREVIRPGVESPYHLVYMQAVTGAGIHYKFTDNYSVGFEAAMQFGISDMAKSSAMFRSHPNQLVFGFGMHYRLPPFRF